MVGELTAQNACRKKWLTAWLSVLGGVPLFVEEVTHLLVERGERGGVDHQFAVMPPSITSSLPVTHDASSEAR